MDEAADNLMDRKLVYPQKLVECYKRIERFKKLMLQQKTEKDLAYLKNLAKDIETNFFPL